MTFPIWCENLRPKRVDFVSCQESLDTTTASGKAFLNMLSAFAQFESDVISERTVNCLAESRKYELCFSVIPLQNATKT